MTQLNFSIDARKNLICTKEPRLCVNRVIPSSVFSTNKSKPSVEISEFQPPF